MKVVILDIDNTLYSWYQFYCKAFDEMCISLSSSFNVPKDVIYREFREVYAKFKDSEHVGAIQQIPSTVNFGPGSEPYVHNAAMVFEEASEKRLKLFDGVADTLQQLQNRDVRIIGCTAARPLPVKARLVQLGVEKYFDRIYCNRANDNGLVQNRTLFFDHGRSISDRLAGFRKYVSVSAPLQKPSQELLKFIARHNMFRDDTDVMFVGDSLERDMRMAIGAGVKSVWAKYGSEPSPEERAIMEKVSWWTIANKENPPEDPITEDQVDHVLTDSFSQLLEIDF